jgi:uncharacterized protein
MTTRLPGTALVIVLLTVAAATRADAPPGYRETIEEWRKTRETRLKAEGGWLSVVGLFWLKDGTNTFGSAPGNDFVFPASAPARAGSFEMKQGRVTLNALAAAAITSEGKPATEMELKPDTSGSPTVLKLGPLTFNVIERQGRYGIRLKDAEAKARREFPGLEWFPVDPAKRVTARFVPYTPQKQVPVPNVLGHVANLPSPGYAEFRLAGRTVRLDPVLEEAGAKELFFIFKDKTSAKSTYGAGRFLYAEMPKDGQLVLDFNKAYTPPCGFTAYATCPLPPPQNRLPVPVEAGEKAPRGAH